MDSVINYMTRIPAIKNLLVMTQHDYLPHDFNPILVENDLYFQLETLNHNDGKLETLKFKLFSYEHDIVYIQAFIEKCNADYNRRQANKLGTSLFFFDMIVDSKDRNSMQNKTPTTHIVYTKHEFHTTRTFDNVFFEQREKVKNHVKFFLTRRDWYESKGIPYTLGFMFHGEPGCGKTSSIKAIANTAKRHIINIQLSAIKSKAQLRHLFFNDEINVVINGNPEKFIIPLNERLYVIEDIDAMGDVVLKREYQRPAGAGAPARGSAEEAEAWISKDDPNTAGKVSAEPPLDLAFLLNLLDGTLESSGRIICISSNFPERIDRALIRPGRIDMIIHFKKCNVAVLREMVSSFSGIPDMTVYDSVVMDYKWSPAEINQILFRNFGNVDEAIKELQILEPKDLYGFSLDGNT
jgi:hypothetical protein